MRHREGCCTSCLSASAVSSNPLYVSTGHALHSYAIIVGSSRYLPMGQILHVLVVVSYHVPASQGIHLSSLSCSSAKVLSFPMYLPIGQLLHRIFVLLTSSSENRLYPQTVHPVEVPPEGSVPRGHPMHADCAVEPLLNVDLPDGQVLQSPTLFNPSIFEYVPVGHNSSQ